jgi:hypothetical protein
VLALQKKLFEKNYKGKIVLFGNQAVNQKNNGFENFENKVT